jgi:hypothetical protein
MDHAFPVGWDRIHRRGVGCKHVNFCQATVTKVNFSRHCIAE